MLLLHFTGYKICIYTGDDKDSGTKANVYMKLFGNKGETDPVQLRKSETNDVQFQPGQVYMCRYYQNISLNF